MRMRSLPNDGLRPDSGVHGHGGVDVARFGRRWPGARRQTDGQARTAGWCGVDVYRALQMRDPLANADESEAAPRVSRLEADAVVLDGDEHEVVDPAQIDDCQGRPRMLRDVGHGFLNDPVQGGFDLGR